MSISITLKIGDKSIPFDDVNLIYPTDNKGIKVLYNCGKTELYPEVYYADIVEDLKWILKEKLSHK